ncbi:MAG TPA: 16S rRNA (cytidine(1402)-2'-O)-methyltransferase [Steroidobacteraceae bacterium]|nr:16S rRNA (cytidine(1402)-2'-O)-methyltransferase [Steroidobacteraceae bacterium]
MAAQRGRLYVVATPIGNLADLSPRAREALAGADLVAAEDTRRTGLLLASLGLSRPLVSLHEHNEEERIGPLLGAMQAGQVVALVSDAGTPLLSDPGFALVRAAAAAGIEVRPIPGVSAITAALSIAGLPTDRFAFEGFLPARATERRRVLGQLAGEARTLVWFEAPHRIAQTLADLLAVFGPQRHAVLTRELTKTYESIYRGTLAELAALARTDADLARGELTLIVEGAARAVHGDAQLLARALPLLLKDLPPARAAAIAAQLSGVPRAEAYRQALALGRDRR